MLFALKQHCSDYSLGVYRVFLQIWVTRHFSLGFKLSDHITGTWRTEYHFSLLKINFSVYWKQQFYLVQDVLAKVEPGPSCTP